MSTIMDSVETVNVDDASPCGNLEQFAQDGGHLEKPKPLFPAITMVELMSGDYRLHYHCKGVLVGGQPMLVGGPHKTFKTTLALELAVSLATGTPFLDHFDVPEPIKVCFFTGEGGLGIIQDTLRRIGQAKHIAISDIENLIVTDRVPRLDNGEHLVALGEYLARHNPAVAFFDPLYLAMGGADTTNVFSMGERLRALNELCLPSGCTPVLLHHLRKNRVDNHAPAGLEDLSMAGFAEFAGQWVLLSRRRAFDPDDPTHRLWISFGGRAGHGSAWGLDVFEGTIDDDGGRVWQTELRRQDDVRAEVHGRRAQQRIDRDVEFEALCVKSLAWITSKPEGVTRPKLQAWLRVGVGKVDQIFCHLEESSSIEDCKIEVKNNKSTRLVDGFRAVDDEEKENLFA